jgi:hypothetical protein
VSVEPRPLARPPADRWTSTGPGATNDLAGGPSAVVSGLDVPGLSAVGQATLAKLQAQLVDFNVRTGSCVSLRFNDQTQRFIVAGSQAVTEDQLKAVFREMNLPPDSEQWYPRVLGRDGDGMLELCLFGHRHSGLPNPWLLEAPMPPEVGRRIVEGHDVYTLPPPAPKLTRASNVRQGEAVLASAAQHDFLVTHSMSDCIGAIFYDPVEKKGLMVHADSTSGERGPHLAELLKGSFSDLTRLQCRLVGGALADSPQLSAIRTALEIAGVQVVESNLGSSPVRPPAIALDLLTGEVTDASASGLDFPLLDTGVLSAPSDCFSFRSDL